MRGRIKVGTGVMQDHGFGKWPATKAGDNVDPDMEFQCEWTGIFWDCRADGHGFLRGRGDIGEYGNGSICVRDKDGVIEVTDL